MVWTVPLNVLQFSSFLHLVSPFYILKLLVFLSPFEACKRLLVTASKDGFKQVSSSSGTQTTSCSSGIEIETGGLPLNKDAAGTSK